MGRAVGGAGWVSIWNFTCRQNPQPSNHICTSADALWPEFPEEAANQAAGAGGSPQVPKINQDLAPAKIGRQGAAEAGPSLAPPHLILLQDRMEANQTPKWWEGNKLSTRGSGTRGGWPAAAAPARAAHAQRRELQGDMYFV
jgi:hypothetical protein